ncbi:MAG: DUF5618 family protein [Bacteroidia bacterium]|nr:DUF5618 family protein [Bacteroidia bacterium]
MEYTELIQQSERYLQNAQDTLKKAGREDGYYKDEKYVKSACGTAYLAALLATDAFLAKYGKKVPEKKGRRHADNYRELLTKQNKKVLNSFNAAYYGFHIDGYYGGVLKANIIKGWFEALEELINEAKK